MGLERNVSGKKFDVQERPEFNNVNHIFQIIITRKDGIPPIRIYSQRYEINYITRGICLSNALANFEDISENKLNNEDND